MRRFVVINPNSKVQTINKKIKLFNIDLKEGHEKILVRIYENVLNLTPAGTNVSLNFFKDGETFHAEALVAGDSLCVLSRKVSHDFEHLTQILNADLIRKLIKQNGTRNYTSSKKAVS